MGAVVGVLVAGVLDGTSLGVLVGVLDGKSLGVLVWSVRWSARGIDIYDGELDYHTSLTVVSEMARENVSVPVSSG